MKRKALLALISGGFAVALGTLCAVGVEDTYKRGFDLKTILLEGLVLVGLFQLRDWKGSWKGIREGDRGRKVYIVTHTIALFVVYIFSILGVVVGLLAKITFTFSTPSIAVTAVVLGIIFLVLEARYKQEETEGERT